MIKDAIQWVRTHFRPGWFCLGWAVLTEIVFVTAALKGSSYGWGYICLFVLIAFLFRPGSQLHKITAEKSVLCRRLFAILLAVATIVACVLPMNAFPYWNGEIPAHRNQYELMAENLLEGRLDFNYGDADVLLELNNPYDPVERKAAGLEYHHWDHAFYDGHYYMYFGVVPVLLTFLPYRVLTGESLVTYQATQLYTAVFIAGMFALFGLLRKRFFKGMPYGVYLALAVSLSAMSVWYASAEPALYCTAITSALALEIWSLYFFARAVWGEQRENRQILFAGIGAALGALVFGCRPTIALANILVIPMLAVFLKQRNFSWKLLGKLALAALPYVVVAAGLMLYNYARFDDPFEFGQKYQLTVADQTQYKIAFDTETNLRLWNETLKNLFGIGTWVEEFPYFKASSVFYNFPMLLLFLIGISQSKVVKMMKQSGVLSTVIGLVIAVLVITVMDILWTPYLLERYRMDIYFLVGIACFLTVGIWLCSCDEKAHKALCFTVMALSVCTVVSAFLLCVRTIGTYYPGDVTEIAEFLHLQS